VGRERRPPIKPADDLTTVDVLSGGRAMLCVDMGYRDEEFAAFAPASAQGDISYSLRPLPPVRLRVEFG
jgi:alkanesulfonate monooxygenase SsuD/methylene tetrahydromethanopterin reductase-like flavin-dependent oxidoreductase (luciferase family)